MRYLEDIALLLESSQIVSPYAGDASLPIVCIAPSCFNSPKGGRMLCESCIENGVKRGKRSIFKYWNENYKSPRYRKCTPKWVDSEEIKKIYKKSRELSNLGYVDYVVDHIVPVKHQKVCGLHCESNLRIIPAEENGSKGNKFKV